MDFCLTAIESDLVKATGHIGFHQRVEGESLVQYWHTAGIESLSERDSRRQNQLKNVFGTYRTNNVTGSPCRRCKMARLQATAVHLEPRF